MIQDLFRRPGIQARIRRRTSLLGEPTHEAPGNCPVCSDELQTVRLECRGCGTGIDGEFTTWRLNHLSGEQRLFVEAFLRRRGKIKDVEEELGISYPTVISRLNDVLVTLGFSSESDSDFAPASQGAAEGAPGGEIIDRDAERTLVLDQLHAGRLTAADAAERLRSLS